MTTKQNMNAFAKWLCAQEGLGDELSVGNAREVWRVLAVELIGNSERLSEGGLLYMSHPFLDGMIGRGLRRGDGRKRVARKKK
jgi:hypothetical protein